MSKIIKITQKEYALKMDKEDSAIWYRIKNNIPLPGVVLIERFGRTVIFHFDTSIDLKEAKLHFRSKNVC